MDFFSRGYSALRGERGQPQSADETIERLADCLETATLLEDRRAAVLSLKGLVKDWPETVGDKSLPALIKGLHMDYRDVDITKSLLETLTILCTRKKLRTENDRGDKYTDYFIEDSSNVTILLDILEEFDFYIRFNTIKLLSTLLSNRPKRIQECILTSPMGITRLVDLLDDKRDIIRNEGLLLLIELTRSNAEVQKLVTFQATFEKLLALIEEQEGISGDIIVQDSLTLMQNLLRYNVSDQIYFRETSCIQQIPGLLGFVGDSEADHIPFSFEDWPPQKVANTVAVLELIRVLTEPDGANTTINQNVMVQSGILLPIVQLGICSNTPSIVRTEALYAIAYVIRDNVANQEKFTKTVVASPPNMIDGQIDPNLVPGLPRPAMVSLIAIAVTADTGLLYSYSSRAAAAFAVSSCVDGNNDTQLVIASMMKLPPVDNANTDFTDKPCSAGSLLLEAIENWELSIQDPYKVWFACVILSHIIKDNEQAKQVAGGIQFGEEDNGEEPVPLLHHIVAQLLLSTKNSATNPRIPVAYLCLLCVWLYDSPASVALFLSESTHVQFLIQEVQSSTNDPTVQGLTAFLLGITYEFNNDPQTPITREKLQAILSSRVDVFNSHITRLRDSNAIKNASQHLEISAEDEALATSTKSLPSLLLDVSFAKFFKDVYETTQRSMKRRPSSFKPKAQSVTMGATDGNPEEIESYKSTIKNQANLIESLEQKVTELETKLAALQSSPENSMTAELYEEKEKNKKLMAIVDEERLKYATLEKEQEDLLVLMGDQDMTNKRYKNRLRQIGEQVTDSENEDEDDE
ncbi:p115 like vesicle tethering protein [Halteromyces radiatus]|uniref:p115 like vesicle tethering protein n=1 Tax=Halteromyces radiatus TaxID=101107 RepID=UPI00221E7C7F|nr:p115 like vesicle tethering protein [Halteromyces radiatus]KAI8084618.1 p115 like vesicle tethering protein [Halteromyces radiatus]